MGTSNSKPQPSAASDSPLGAPGGNEPYKTKRAINWANPDMTGSMSDKNVGADAGKEAEDMTSTKMIGNAATGSLKKKQPKPAQGA